MSSHTRNNSTDGSTNLSMIPLPVSDVYAVWSPAEQHKYANEPIEVEEELVVKSGPPAKLERCDNRISKKEVLRAIDDYVKGIRSKLTHQEELEDELTYVNADVKKVLAEPDCSRVLNEIYVKYSTYLVDTARLSSC